MELTADLLEPSQVAVQQFDQDLLPPPGCRTYLDPVLKTSFSFHGKKLGRIPLFRVLLDPWKRVDSFTTTRRIKHLNSHRQHRGSFNTNPSPLVVCGILFQPRIYENVDILCIQLEQFHRVALFRFCWAAFQRGTEADHP